MAFLTELAKYGLLKQSLYTSFFSNFLLENGLFVQETNGPWYPHECFHIVVLFCNGSLQRLTAGANGQNFVKKHLSITYFGVIDRYLIWVRMHMESAAHSPWNMYRRIWHPTIILSDRFEQKTVGF